jgi:hypothetical protein
LAIFNHRPPTSWLDHVGSIHMFGGCMGLRWRVNCLPCFGGPMNMTTKRQHPTMDTMAVSTSKSRVIYFQCHNFWTWYSHRWVWSTRQRNDIHLAGDVSSYQPGRAQNMCVLWWCSQPIVDAFRFPCVLMPYRWLPYLENLVVTFSMGSCALYWRIWRILNCCWHIIQYIYIDWHLFSHYYLDFDPGSIHETW